MSNRSLLKQFQQIKGAESFFDTIDITYGEYTGREYDSETLIVVSGTNTITCSGVLEESEIDNYIVIDAGDAAGVYEMTAVSGTTATVSPTPTGTDVSASGRKHYFQNLEDDLNYIRAMLADITGETSWNDAPASDIAALVSDLATTSGTLQTQITTNAGDISNLDTKIDTTSGTLQIQINNIGTGKDFRVITTTSGITVDSYDRVLADSSGGAFTITLPFNSPTPPVIGDVIEVMDSGNSFDSNPVTVHAGSNNIIRNGQDEFSASQTKLLYQERGKYTFTYSDGGRWLMDAPAEEALVTILMTATPHTAITSSHISVAMGGNVTVNLPNPAHSGDRVLVSDITGIGTRTITVFDSAGSLYIPGTTSPSYNYVMQGSFVGGTFIKDSTYGWTVSTNTNPELAILDTNIAQNTWDISVVSGTVDEIYMTPVWLTSATYSANSNELIEVYYNGDVTITVPDPSGYAPGERIIIRDVYGNFDNSTLTISVLGGNSLIRTNDYNWYGEFKLGGKYFSYELVRVGLGAWLLSNGNDSFIYKKITSGTHTAKAWDELILDSSAPITINFPASPRVGTKIRIIDGQGAIGKTPCTVNAGGALQGFTSKDPSLGYLSTVYLKTPLGQYEFLYNDSGHWVFYDFTIPYTNTFNISSGGSTIYYGDYLVRADTTGGAFSLALDGDYWTDNSKVTIIDVGGVFSTNNLQLTSSYTIAGPGVTNGTSVYLDQDYGVYIVTLDKANSLFLIDIPYNTDGLTTVSGVDVEMTYDAGTWTYDGNFTSVPDSLMLFCNGIKQKRNDAEYYTASTVSGILNINFGFSTDTDDWVNIMYNSYS